MSRMESKVIQKIKNLKVSDLHLWTENPRDPIDLEMSDLEIIKRAISDGKNKWNLPKLIKEMGNHYDLSELPTAVFENKKYLIYDGNRRLAVLKYLQNPGWSSQIEGKLFPSLSPGHLKNLLIIPCNICDKKTALKNIRRKHITNGSWGQLERDYFECKHLGKEKSLFVKFEEATGLISANSSLNENIMKKNILTESKLKNIGFYFDDHDNLISVYDEKLANEILNRVAELKKEGIISSRGKDKYQIKVHLDSDPRFKGKIKKFNESSAHLVNYVGEKEETPAERKTRRQNAIKNSFFGGILYLKSGRTNDLYLDILALYNYYIKNQNKLSNTFPNIIRMALRLLVDSAKDEQRESIEKYIESNFTNAKSNLTQDQKTTLSGLGVDKLTIINLLHTGAHNYSNSSNFEQTIAISIIIGEMLKITHGREDKKKEKNSKLKRS